MSNILLTKFILSSKSTTASFFIFPVLIFLFIFITCVTGMLLHTSTNQPPEGTVVLIEGVNYIVETSGNAHSINNPEKRMSIASVTRALHPVSGWLYFGYGLAFWVFWVILGFVAFRWARVAQEIQQIKPDFNSDEPFF